MSLKGTIDIVTLILTLGSSVAFYSICANSNNYRKKISTNSKNIHRPMLIK